MDWIKKFLSDEQLKPFANSRKNSCILAAAGSGKTRTLVQLIANDLASGTPASAIIAFTFTEKAATELLARIHTIVKENIPKVDLNGIFIGTIHSWCLNYLASQDKFYNFEPIDELHLYALASRFYDFLELENVYRKKFPRAIDDFLADLEIFYNENFDAENVPDKIKPCVKKLLIILNENRLVTFGGMIRNAIEQLAKCGPMNDLKRLYVDEYQDVNPAQVLLIHCMLPENGHLTVVGDDLQCIYNWRGSDVGRIIQFSNDFSDTSTYRLSYNYRSRPEIVKVSNSIADGIFFRDREKVMVPKRDAFGTKIVHWLSSTDENTQIQEIIEIVKKFSLNGLPYNKIAILLRSVLSWGPEITNALVDADIPVNCPILSRGGTFIDTFLIPILNWLLSDQRDPNSEEEEIENERISEKLWESAKAWGVDPQNELFFWDSLNGWWDVVNDNANDSYDIRGRLYDFLQAIGIGISPTDSDLLIGLGIGSQIIRSIEEIHRRRMKGHNRKSGKGVIREVYYALLRKQHDFGESLPIDTSSEGVLVSTIHQAKGLEWPVVILPMLMNGRFPIRKKGHGTSFSDSVASRYGTSLEDERRLFYVAFTRARERQFLLDPCLNNNKRSIFLNDLKSNNSISISTFNGIDSKTWKISEKDLEESDKPPISIGLTDLLLYLECPFEFALRRVAAVQPSIGDDLGYGKGLHELIQRRIENQKPWSSEDLTSQINAYVHLPYSTEKQENISRNAIARRVKNLEGLDAFSTNIKSEVPVEVLFENGIVRGIVDGIQENRDGSLFIRDWKSSLHEIFLNRYERQLQFYTYALNGAGKKVVGADIIDVKASEKFEQLISKSVDISEESVSKTIESLNKALQDIARNEYSPNPNPKSCACCDIIRICKMRCDYEPS
jgi:DNA helicase II / ATP-dependent DNA helicase PcrA